MAIQESGVEIRRSVCPHDCPDTCSMLVHVRDGRALKVVGDPEHPVTRGFLCVKVNNYVDRVYSPDRVLTPLRRVGAKGEGKFERISWDEALDEVADRFKHVVTEHGPEAILPYSYAGTMGLLNYASMDRRFFYRLGASLLDRTICSTAGAAGYRYTLGASIGTDPETFPDAKLIILWGTNTVATNVHLVPFIREAVARGAMVVVIDVRRTRTADLGHWFLQPRPGTDGALALGLMHVLIAEGWYDAEYVAAHTVGFPELAERVRQYPPERVAEITGLAADDVVRLARLYAERRPAAIRINYGLQRHSNGGMTVRNIACLPALVGDWRYPGGGVVLSTSGTFPVNKAALERVDLLRGTPRTINMIQLGDALLRADPPVKALYVYNSNPAAVAPDQAKVLAGLRRDDLFVVVHEQMLTDTCRYADIVLPATTTLEHLDLHTSYGHLYLQLNEPAISPVGESKPNTEVFRLLAARMGFDEPCFQNTDEDLIRQALDSDDPRLEGITLERLRREKSVRLNVPRPFVPFADGKFPTPSGKVELYSARMAADGFDPLPTYEPPAESPAGSPELANSYPISLVTPAAHHFLNSTFSNVDKLRSLEKRPLIEIHPADAATRGIRDGDRVRVYNQRGECYMYAVVSEGVRPGVATHTSLWWLRDSEGPGNCNQTTSARVADMGGGATFHDNLVQIDRAE